MDRRRAGGRRLEPLRELLGGRELQDELIRRIERRATPTGRHLGPRYLASYAVHAVTAIPAAVLLLDDRVLALDVDRLAVRPDDIGWLADVALDASGVSVLEGDPLAGAPGVRTVGDRDALRAAFVDELLGVLHPVVDALERHQRPGRRNTWYFAIDALGSACAALGAEATADAAMDGLLRSAAGTPLRAHRRHFVRDPGTGGQCWALNGCCRADQFPGHGHCAMCPKRTLEDSRAQLARASELTY